jgi:dienelactone hydrolase
MASQRVASATVPRIEGAPAESLFDEPLQLRLTGLPPAAPVTLRARMQEDNGQWWESATEFVAGPDGTVDVADQAPVAGGYVVADPMGFIWSMRPAGTDPVQRPFWLMKANPLAIELTAEVDGGPTATATLKRNFMGPGVTRTEVRDDGLVATFFAPAGNTPAPGVIIVPGSGGGLSESAAALLASHGFAGLALAYFRAEQLPADLVDIPLEYFETAINWLQAQDAVDADRIAFGGTSRGGELALLVGSRFPAVTAVIGWVPSGIVYGGLASPERAKPEPAFAWTHGGEGVTFLGSRRDRGAPAESMKEGVPFALTPGFLASLKDEEEAEAAAIPVERINGPVLLISGDADAMWPGSLFSQRVMARLKEHRHPYPDQHLSYPNAGHLIGAPYVPTTVSDIQHAVTGGYFALGGTPAGTAFARADSWPRVIAFLEQLRS